MKCAKVPSVSLLILAVGAPLCAHSHSDSRVEVTPVQKVVQLLTGMLEKGRAEKHEEQVQFAAFKQFCDDTSIEKKRAIEEESKEMEVLKADIEKAAADVTRLSKEVSEHDKTISVFEGDMKAATKVRDIEKADYDTTHKDYSESIDALESAMALLEKQAYNREQASLIQLSSLSHLELIPPSAKRVIEAFLAEDSENPAAGLDVTAPLADGYEFRSSGVIDMLKKLHSKFAEEKTALEKEEMSSRQAYELLMQDLVAQVDQHTRERGEKAKVKAVRLQKKAEAKGGLTETSAARVHDLAYLKDLTATCKQKAGEFESRQQLRTDELQAVEKAIEIISGEALSGNAEKHLPSMLQRRSTALVHLRTDAANAAQHRMSRYLRERSQELGSSLLFEAAARAADDPFEKVKKMIKDLIVRLMEEANEEAEHKGWCDTELATNEQTRREKTDAVEMLHAEMDEIEASIAKLTESMAELTTAVADIDTAMAKATEIRQEETTTNAETIKDAKDAQAAVAQALTVLKEFYAKAGEATVLIQESPSMPEIFDSPYKGMQGENGGVIGMLEVIQSDFARLEAETRAAEATAQKEYDAFATTSKVDKEEKLKDIEHKTAKKQDVTQAKTVTTSDLEGTQKELNAALEYFEKLKPSCVESGVSYEDRVARRKEEIESLQEAIQILNGEDIP